MIIKDLITDSNFYTYKTTVSYSGSAAPIQTTRHNPNTQELEPVVSYGSVTPMPYNNLHLSLSPDVLEVIEWAKRKMKEEELIQKLAQENDAVRETLNTVLEAQEKLKVVIALTDKHE